MMLRSFLKSIAILLLLVSAGSAWAEADSNLDKNLQNLSWSGFLRTRGWYINGGSPISSADNKRNLSFQDLFFRNRFTLQVLPNLKIYSLFDVGTIKFGSQDANRETGSELGSPQAKIQAKNIYFQFRPFKSSIITAGLQPFALPGGHIIAKDGAGLKYQHRLFKGRFNPYFMWIKAFENSDTDVNGNDVLDDNFDHNIFIAGSKISLGRDFKSEVYYVYSEDLNQFISSIPTKSPLVRNWVGMHSQWLFGDISLNWGTIINWGFIQTNVASTSTVPPEKVDLLAGLWEFKIGYTIGDLQLALMTEGATGDASNERNKHSFQGIFASHGFSNILIDNSGGIAIRSGGQLFGLHGYGLSVDYLLLSKLKIEGKYIHFRTIYDEGRGQHFGDEGNLEAKYTAYQKLSVFLSAGGFWPAEAYKVFINSYEQKPIFEMMLGAQINY